MTPLDALTAAGLGAHNARVQPRPGAWEPRAVFWHHTGTPNPPKPGVPASRRICQQGRSDVPGPLCQWLVGGDGDWWWITEGKANHAGTGSKTTAEWVAATTRPDDPPRPGADDSSAANRYTIGVEVEGTGNWSPLVHDSLLRGTRALLRYYGLRRDSLISHREWTRRKTDPAGIDMAAARAWLRANPTPPPLPQPQEDEDVLIVFSDKTGTDQSQLMQIDGKLYVIDEGDTAQGLAAAGVKTVPIGRTDYAQLKQKAEA